MQKSVKDYIKTVTESEELSDLYLADIELEKIKGELFIARKNPNSMRDDTELMADINLATKLQIVAEERRKKLADEEHQMCYKFYKNAAYFIDRELYNKIYRSALIPRSVFRQQMIKENGRFQKVK